MKKFLFVASGLVLAFLAEHAQAQNVVRDYVLDRHVDYQPDDHVNRGFIYRLQTGHAGLFKNCDGDLNKMYSPYINWNCRPGSPPRPVSNVASDFDRKLTHFHDGAGACAVHPAESYNTGLIRYETIDRESQAAPHEIMPDEVSQSGRHIHEPSRVPLQRPAPVDDLSADRFEQLRIKRMHR